MALENLNINITTTVEGTAQVEALTAALYNLAGAQRVVDENQNINVDVDRSNIRNITNLRDGLADIEGLLQSDIFDTNTGRGGSFFGGTDFDENLAAGNIGVPGINLPTAGGGGGGDGGDMDGTDLNVGALRRMFRKFGFGTEEERFNPTLKMEQIHNIVAGIVPLLVTFVGSLPAAITSLVALAAAAASAAAALITVAGLGALGAASQRGGGGMPSAQDLQAIFKDIYKGLEPLLDVAHQLAPLFEDFIDSIRGFAADLNNVIEDNLDTLEQAAIGFGRWLHGAILGLISGASRLLEAFDTEMGNIARWFENADIVGGLIEFGKEITPILGSIVTQLVDFLPFIIRLSTGFLILIDVVTKIHTFISGLFNLLSQLPVIGVLFDKFALGLGLIISTLLTFGSFVIVTTSFLAALYNAFSLMSATVAEASVSLGIFSGVTLTASASMLVFTTVMGFAITTLIGLLASVLIGGMMEKTTGAGGMSTPMSKNIKSSSSSVVINDNRKTEINVEDGGSDEFIEDIRGETYREKKGYNSTYNISG